LIKNRLPEPTEDFEKGCEILKKDLTEFKPDVLIGCSRGAKYIMEIINSKDYAGPTLLISAMTMSKCVPEKVPVIFAHGTKDLTIPIFTVESSSSMGSPEICKVVSFDDDHSLHSLENSGEFGKLIQQVFDFKNVEVKEKKKSSVKIPVRGDFLSQIKSRK
jgi:hypothetical protein